jgi:hypothetical protein
VETSRLGDISIVVTLSHGDISNVAAWGHYQSRATLHSQECTAKKLESIIVMAMLHHRGGLVRLTHVQFWETENSGRLDSSHRGGHRRDIPCLVDASDVRTVNALEGAPA